MAVNDYPSVAAAIDALTRKNVDVIWTSAEQKLYDTAAVRTLLLAALRKQDPGLGLLARVRPGRRPGRRRRRAARPGGAGRGPGNKLLAGTRRPAGAPAAGSADEGRAQPPREFQIAVNLIVARQLGVDVPEPVARRAAFVYRPEN